MIFCAEQVAILPFSRARYKFPPLLENKSDKCFYFSKANTVVGDTSIFVMAQRLVPISFTLAPSR